MQVTNWDHWLELRAWKLWQAAYLIQGFEPPESNAGFEAAPRDPLLFHHRLPVQITTMYQRIEAAVAVNALKASDATDMWERFVRVIDIAHWGQRDLQRIPAQLENYIKLHDLAPQIDALAHSSGRLSMGQAIGADEPPSREAPEPPEPSAQFAHAAAAIPAMTAEQLAGCFGFPDNDGGLSRIDDWKHLGSEAKTNGLISCIATRGAGRRPHTFEVESVAAWLVKTRQQDPAIVAHAVLRAIPSGPEFDAKRNEWDLRAKGPGFEPKRNDWGLGAKSTAR